MMRCQRWLHFLELKVTPMTETSLFILPNPCQSNVKYQNVSCSESLLFKSQKNNLITSTLFSKDIKLFKLLIFISNKIDLDDVVLHSLLLSLKWCFVSYDPFSESSSVESISESVFSSVP